MPPPKQFVSTAQISDLATMLRELAEVTDKLAKDIENAGATGLTIDGWRTCGRGLQFLVDQIGKMAGPLTVAKIDPKSLMGEGLEYAPTRKPSKAIQERDKHEAEEKLAEAHKQVAEAKKPPKKPKDDPKP
jgi:hypothetical protein